MDVAFSKRPDGGSLALIDREDGVRLRLRSYDRTGEVPHDAVHLIGERALGLTGGLWGSLQAGALFDSVEVVSGRLRHDRRQRSDAVRRENAAELRLAETVVGVLQQSLDRRRSVDEGGAGPGVGDHRGPARARSRRRRPRSRSRSCAPCGNAGAISPRTRRSRSPGEPRGSRH